MGQWINPQQLLLIPELNTMHSSVFDLDKKSCVCESVCDWVYVREIKKAL